MKANLFERLFSSKGAYSTLSRGFTLIELLIVIAIIGVLAAGVLVLVDPIDKIAAANDAKVQNDISGMGRAAEAYATVHLGFYPPTLAALATTGELKRVPTAPSGYSAYNAVVAGCSASGCTSIVITGQLKSKKYTQAVPALNTWRFESSTGKSCAAATAATACP